MKTSTYSVFLFVCILLSCNKRERQDIVKKRIKSTQQIEYKLNNWFVVKLKGERVSPTGYGEDYIENFDIVGNLIKAYSLENSTDLKFVLRSKYEYNDDNQIIKETRFTDKHTVFYTLTYKYDKQHRLIEEDYKVSTNTIGLESTLSIYEYDKNQFAIFHSIFDTIQNKYILNNTELVKRDKNNNEIENFRVDVDKKIYLKVYKKYDQSNNVIQYTSIDERFTKGEKCTIDDEYNRNNNITRSVYNNKDTELITKYEYEYDIYGNWIVQKVIEENKIGKYFERSITYY